SLLVGLDTGTVAGVSAVVVGVLATAIGRIPGGLAGTLRRMSARPAAEPRLTPAGERLRHTLAGRAAAAGVQADAQSTSRYVDTSAGTEASG
ncbi:ABC transporter permease, partial [Kitasatospora sp. NPDC059571]